MKPGIYSNAELSNEAYHASEGVSSTTLKEVRRSPAHALALKQGLRRKVSDSISLGTIIHAAVLEPETFGDLYRLPPARSDFPSALETVDDMKRAAKAHGVDLKGISKKADIAQALVDAEAPVQFWDDVKALPEGVTPLTLSQHEAVQGVLRSLDAEPNVQGLFQGGVAEQSVYWEDHDTGLLCKLRTDYYLPEYGLVVDLKTCQDARLEAAQRSIVNYGYDFSAAMYLDGLRQQGMKADGFAWVFIETEPPYAMKVYYASAEVLERGHRLYRDSLETFALCLQADNWPGYSTAVEPIGLPAWARPRDTDNDSYLAA